VLDFTHAKIYAELDATVRVTGAREGAPVDADLDGGGSLEVAPWTHHISAGLSFTFR
jgi:hypothetical protein